MWEQFFYFVATTGLSIALGLGATFMYRRTETTIDNMKHRISELEKQNKRHSKRYQHLREYYSNLAVKYNTLRSRFIKVKEKLFHMVELHFGKDFVQDVLKESPALLEQMTGSTTNNDTQEEPISPNISSVDDPQNDSADEKE